LADSPEQVARKIEAAWADFERMIPAFMKNAAEIIVKDRKANFMKGKGPNGESWARLKLATVKSKRKEHKTTRVKRKKGISGLGVSESKPAKYPTKPLIDTGSLMNATSHVKGKTAIVKMARSRSEAVTGGFESIAKVHQEGLGNNPPRPHWGIPQQSERAIERAWRILFRDKFLRKVDR
jgi:hypothetical protein